MCSYGRLRLYPPFRAGRWPPARARRPCRRWRGARWRSRRCPAANSAWERSRGRRRRSGAAGMALGEALARCPELVLVPADPRGGGAGMGDGGACAGIDRRGASSRRGRGWPTSRAMGCGGSTAAHGARRSRQPRAPGALRSAGARRGSAPARRASARWRRRWRCARAARSCVEDARRPALARRAAGRAARLPQRDSGAGEPLSRLGVRTLGELTRLGRAALDRSLRRGGRARPSAGRRRGHAAAHAPRRGAPGGVDEVGEASSGAGAGARAGRARRPAAGAPRAPGAHAARGVLSARLVAGGGWRERVVFRQALSDAERIWLALSLRCSRCRRPAARCGLAVERFGPPTASRARCSSRSAQRRRPPTARARLREAVAQVRAVAGPDAALRAVCVDPDSRVPERRVVLTPLPE